MLNVANKQEIRKHLKALRSQMTAEYVAQSSNMAAQQILACDAYQKAKLIMGYLAFGKEVSVDTVLLQALADGKQVVVPFITSDTEMEAALLRNMQDLCLDRYGIRCVCKPPDLIDPEQIDLILVPGVAFALDGSRMGMGAGYYDRFLQRCPMAATIGIAYEKLLQDSLPTDEYDIPVQYLACEAWIRKLHP